MGEAMIATTISRAEFESSQKAKLAASAEFWVWPLLAIGIGVVLLIGWLYYKEWRDKRDFQRFLESKRRKT
jgi:hypothetical protein